MLPFEVSQQAPSTMDRIANALQGFGAGVAGRGGEFLRNQQLQRQELSDERKRAAAEDLLRVKELIGAKDLKGVQALGQERLGYINQLGGDPSDTEQLIALATQAETDPVAYQRLLAEVNSGLRSAERFDIINLPKTVEKFEAVRDSDGNVIAQKNTTTGEVIADPRKPEDRDNYEIVYNDQGEAIGQKNLSGEITALPEGFTSQKPTWTTLSPEKAKNYGFGDGYIVQESKDGSLKVINEEFMKASRKLSAEQRKQGIENAKILEEGTSTINLIDSMIGNKDVEPRIPPHPSLADAIGWFDQLTLSTFAGTIDFETRVEQLKGKAFLNAFQKLKGGGPITETEGQAATAAQARLNMAQDEDDFIAALTEMRALTVRTIQNITSNEDKQKKPLDEL